jgi:hypothetical protein
MKKKRAKKTLPDAQPALTKEQKASIAKKIEEQKEEKKTLHELKEEFIEHEANGMDVSESASTRPDLADLEYADGKVRDEIDLIEEQEKIYGTDLLSPYKTADKRVFKRRLESMNRPEMYRLAERVAARIYTGEEDMRNELMSSFLSWFQTSAGSSQTIASKKEEKGVKAEAFEDPASVNDLEEKLKSKTLSDLQATAARLGFNPGFDRNRLITLIKQEYQRQN